MSLLEVRQSCSCFVFRFGCLAVFVLFLFSAFLEILVKFGRVDSPKALLEATSLRKLKPHCEVSTGSHVDLLDGLNFSLAV